MKIPPLIVFLIVTATGPSVAEIVAGKNLLTNGSATAPAATGWTIIANGGSGWGIGGGGYDSEGGYFITSYSLCQRSQIVDLLASGATAAELDAAPPLRVSEAISMYNGNQNNDTYYIRVELRNASGGVVASWDAGTSAARKPATNSWVVESHEFRDYGPGVRYVYFEDGGIDGGFWAGNYGTYHDAATVAFTNQPVTDIVAIPASFPANVPAGGIAAQLRATDADNLTHTFTLEAESSPTSEVLLAAGATGWRYYDSAVPPPADWASSAFDDSSWGTGAAPLGYDSTSPVADTWQVTRISYGSNAAAKPLTAWFRKTFTVSDPAAFTALEATLMVDDGCVVYLNGQELFRDGMADGAVTDTTVANRTVGGTDESDYDPVVIPPAKLALLVPGTNVLAVEVHQDKITSSDLSIDMTLKGTGIGAVNNYSNDLFEFSGSELRVKNGSGVMNSGPYTVRVKAVDAAGNALIKNLTVQRTDAVSIAAPTGLTLAPATIVENTPAGSLIGALTVADADAGDAFGFALEAGAGDDDNARVTIADSRLIVAQSPDFELGPAWSVRVRVTDSAGATYSQVLSIAVTDNTTEDQDGDGLTEAEEDVNNNSVLDPGETDPMVADTDGDGFSDRVERSAGSDPRDAASVPSVLELRQLVTHPTGDSWLTAASWEGSVVPTSMHRTVTDNLTFRSPPSADPVFPGAAAELRNGAIFRMKHTGLATVARTILRNGTIQHGMTVPIGIGGPGAVVEVPTTGTFDTATYDLELHAGLSGSGTVRVIGTTSGALFGRLKMMQPSPAFTGELSLEAPETVLVDPAAAGAARRIAVKSGVFRTQASVSLPATLLQRSGTGKIDLTHSISAGDLMVDGVVVAPGTYTGAQLTAAGLPADAFEDNGATITVNGTLGSVDTDGDGSSDLLELLAGTDPNNSASRFAMSGLAATGAGKFRLDWPAVAGTIYTVQSADSLAGPWQDVTTVTPTTTGASYEVSLTAPYPARIFFRIAIK